MTNISSLLKIFIALHRNTASPSGLAVDLSVIFTLGLVQMARRYVNDFSTERHFHAFSIGSKFSTKLNRCSPSAASSQHSSTHTAMHHHCSERQCGWSGALLQVTHGKHPTKCCIELLTLWSMCFTKHYYTRYGHRTWAYNINITYAHMRPLPWLERVSREAS